MLKKTLFFAFLLTSSSFSFAKNNDSTLSVAPYNPEQWGYINAKVEINHNVSYRVGNEIMLPVSINDHISLMVYAMNAKPKLDKSCENIQIQQEGKHQLLFDLKNDWLIHCHYSFN